MNEIPKPVVIRYVKGTFKIRKAREFPEAELKEAGISRRMLRNY